MRKYSVYNLIFNIVSMLLSIGLSFFVSPFIINTIGAESYGFIPLTQQTVNYMTVISVSLTAVSGRFFITAKADGDRSLVQDYFGSILYICAILSIVLAVIFSVSLLFIDNIIKVPQYLLGDVRISYAVFAVAFILTFATSCFNVAPFSANKLYLTGGVNMLQAILRTGTILLLCLAFVPKIWYISVGNLLAAAVSLFLAVIIFKRLEPQIKITARHHSKAREIGAAGMWVSLSEIGVVLFLQIDLWVSNRNLTPLVAGEYSVVLQLPTVIRTFSALVTSIFPPVIMSLYAAGKRDELRNYVNNSVSWVGLAFALPIGVLGALGGSFLGLWINPSFAQYQWILFILIIHLSVNLPVQIIMSVQTAANRLKTPAFVTLIMGGLNFVMAYTLSGPLKLGVFGIAISGSIVLTLKNLVFTPFYAAYITGESRGTYFRGVVKPLAATLLVFALTACMARIIPADSYLKLIVIGCIVSALYLPLAWFGFIEKKQRTLLKSAVITKILKK